MFIRDLSALLLAIFIGVNDVAYATSPPWSTFGHDPRYTGTSPKT